jgi:predicted enzyme related to lactoylglutathione lyase
LLIGSAHAPTENEAGPPHWTVSFRVADADEDAARVAQLGGRVLLPPMDIPIGRFALVSDPAGAAFSITAFAGSFRSVDRS